MSGRCPYSRTCACAGRHDELDRLSPPRMEPAYWSSPQDVARLRPAEDNDPVIVGGVLVLFGVMALLAVLAVVG